ncbi:unnamed protein product [Phytophthora fragariaefolia]|uniref:Unnamed protein product n=1 Tax=Phytophthora fragariaefolia TaxID=1490495 RepID=A0A9W6Y5L2_9STRA|nr:unnamed protein product [Phytophthora fragariaefolia]
MSVKVGLSKKQNGTVPVVPMASAEVHAEEGDLQPSPRRGRPITIKTDLPGGKSTSVGDWKDEEFDVSDSLFANWIQDGETSHEPESDVIQVAKDSVKAVSWYDRLFTDEELDAMEQCEPEQEATVIAGSEVAKECEEYGKEIEVRLYPLDEVELGHV